MSQHSTANAATRDAAMPVFVTLPDAATRVSLCERTLRRAISRGDLRGFKIGKSVRVKLTELDAWAESHAIPNARSTAKAAR